MTRSRTSLILMILLSAVLALALVRVVDDPAPGLVEVEEVHHVKRTNQASGAYRLSHKWSDGDTIYRGTTGPGVKLIQGMLNRMGYHTYSQSSCSGKFIDHTNGVWNGCDDWAVRAFQRYHGLPESGNVYWSTFEKLQEYFGRGATHLYSGTHSICQPEGWYSIPPSGKHRCDWRADDHHAPRRYLHYTYWDEDRNIWAYWDHIRGRWYSA